jgi:hypothetical protein
MKGGGMLERRRAQFVKSLTPPTTHTPLPKPPNSAPRMQLVLRQPDQAVPRDAAHCEDGNENARRNLRGTCMYCTSVLTFLPEAGQCDR